VSNIYDPMDVDLPVDGVGRKRAMDPTQSSNEEPSDSKSKRVSTSEDALSRGSADSGNKSKIQYVSTDNPPYIVHVHSLVNDPAKSLHPLLISRALSRIAYSEIKEIKKIDRGKVLVEMTSAKAANDLTNNCSLEKEGLTAFVPVCRTVRSGIVKDPATFR